MNGMRAIAVSILVLLVTIIPSIIAVAQDGLPANVPSGYNITQGPQYTTIYNPQDIKSVFGYEPVAGNGLLKIIFSTGRQTELGYVYGKVIADTENKKIKIANGGFIGLGRIPLREGETLDSGEEAPKRMLLMNITGDLVEINAKNMPLTFTAKNGIYSNNDYSFVCDGECTFNAEVSQAFLPSVRITGNANIVRSDMLERFLDGKEINAGTYAPISGFDAISVLQGKNLSLEFYKRANVRGLEGMFNRIGIISDSSFQITRSFRGTQFFDFISPLVINNAPAGDIKMTLSVSPDANMAVFSPSANSVIIVKMAGFDGAGVVPLSTGAGMFNLAFVHGVLRIVPDADEFAGCKPIGFSCLFAETARGRVNLKPDTSATDTAFKIIFPRVGPLMGGAENLLLERMGENIVFIIGREGMSNTLTFKKGDVTAENGNWFDVGVSFSAYVFENVGIYNKFECDAILKECWLDGQKVSGFEEQETTSCRRDSNCSGGMSCRCLQETRGSCSPALKRCMRNLECSELREINPSARPGAIDFLLIPDGYDNREEFVRDAQKVADGIFAVQPFGANRNKFMFYTTPIGTELAQYQSDIQVGGAGIALPFTSMAHSMVKQCGSMDVVMVLSKKSFVSFADSSGIIAMSMPETSSMATVVHELGHGFGSLSDEYVLIMPGKSGNLMGPNCIADERAAKRIWSGLLNSDEEAEALIADAKSWPVEEMGCGGLCNARCKSYIRPSLNSIMRHEGTAEEGRFAGSAFNTISLKWLQNKISAFG